MSGVNHGDKNRVGSAAFRLAFGIGADKQQVIDIGVEQFLEYDRRLRPRLNTIEHMTGFKTSSLDSFNKNYPYFIEFIDKIDIKRYEHDLLKRLKMMFRVGIVSSVVGVLIDVAQKVFEE